MFNRLLPARDISRGMCATRYVHRGMWATLWLALLFVLAACASAPGVGYIESGAAAPAPAAAPESALESWAEEAAGFGAAGAEVSRRVISTARLELVVQDAGETADRITLIVNEAGGYVGATNLYKTTSDGSEALQGSITLRVPAEELDNVMEQLESLAIDVRSKTTNRQDVTDQFSDIEAQLRTLEATETELMELLAEVRAKPNATADEIMAVYYRLTEIRTEIERLQGRLNLLDNQVRLSTLEVSLIPDVGSRPVVQPGWQPGVEVRAALRTLVSATQGLVNLLIWGALFVLPLMLLLLIPLVVVFYVLRLLYRRYNRRRVPAQSV